MGVIIDKATVEKVDHDGDPNVVCLLVDGERITEEEDCMFWQEFCAEGWKVTTGNGPTRKSIYIHRREE